MVVVVLLVEVVVNVGCIDTVVVDDDDAADAVGTITLPPFKLVVIDVVVVADNADVTLPFDSFVLFTNG